MRQIPLDTINALRYISNVVNRRPAERVVRRYGNRKLYDPATRHYVTLPDLARMIAQGEDVRVVDHQTEEDLTTTVLAQVILDGIRERTASVPRQVLARLIRLGFAPGRPWGEWTGPQQAAARARTEAERIASELLARGRLTLEEALTLRQEIARSVTDLVGEAQRAFEDRLHQVLEKGEREGSVSKTLHGLRDRLLAFETYLETPGPAPRGAARRRGGRPPRRGGKRNACGGKSRCPRRRRRPRRRAGARPPTCCATPGPRPWRHSTPPSRRWRSRCAS
jgi:polyhydroxyalkanoate synthesis repressor PhaR